MSSDLGLLSLEKAKSLEQLRADYAAAKQAVCFCLLTRTTPCPARPESSWRMLVFDPSGRQRSTSSVSAKRSRCSLNASSQRNWLRRSAWRAAVCDSCGAMIPDRPTCCKPASHSDPQALTVFLLMFHILTFRLQPRQRGPQCSAWLPAFASSSIPRTTRGARLLRLRIVTVLSSTRFCPKVLCLTGRRADHPGSTMISATSTLPAAQGTGPAPCAPSEPNWPGARSKARSMPFAGLLS